MNRGTILLWTLAVGLIIWLPRGLALDRFVTADEHAWLTRSGNFYLALATEDFGNTFQRHHPGVTVTWAGTLGILSTYPAYAQEAPKQFGWLTEEIEPFVEEQGLAAIDLLAAGRRYVVIFITLALVASFWLSVRLLGFWAGAVGIGLIGSAPFHVGLSRLMHLDGLLSTFMLLSLLAFLASWRTGLRAVNGLVVLSGIAAGLAWLTRSPGLFLGPFLGLMTIGPWALTRVSQSRPDDQTYSGQSGQPILRLVLWALIGGLTFIALWPAMWVAPIQSISEVVNAARNYAAEGHLKPIFFDGQVFNGDPGFWFYPVSFLWRTTPVTLIGLAIGVVGLTVTTLGVGKPSADEKGQEQDLADSPSDVRLVLGVLLLFGVLFGLFMNLGDKKFDRYLLPTYLPLMLVAGWGWAWLFGGIGQAVGRQMIPAILAGLVVISQAAFALPTFPYYLSFYNPLMGGAAAAPSVMQIGWGEAADQAARVLNERLIEEGRDTTKVRVASAYTNGPFSYFFEGETLPIYFWHQAEYGVVYAQDFQRRLPGPRQIRYFEELEALETVHINRVEYARVYDFTSAPLPDYVTDWQVSADSAIQIRLVSYLFPSSQIDPGEPLPMTLYFENLSPIEEDLSVLVRLTGVDGAEIARSEGWPQGRPTSTWEMGDTWADGHSLSTPAETAPGIYRLDVSFYDPSTLERLIATRPLTGELLGDTLHLDYVQVGQGKLKPTLPLTPNTVVDGRVELLGTSWQSGNGQAINIEPIDATPGEVLALNLHWQTLNHMDRSNTTFVHVSGPDGVPLTQMDQQPWGGFYPTQFWSKGRTVAQPISIQIPTNAQPGTYPVHVGMYDSETVIRLPIERGGKPVGDSIIVAHIKVEG